MLVTVDRYQTITGDTTSASGVVEAALTTRRRCSRNGYTGRWSRWNAPNGSGCSTNAEGSPSTPPPYH